MSFADAHGVPTDRRNERRFNGVRSYKARKLAGAISEVREKYATEAQSRGSDAFHARPPEFRGILEFFSDISRGSCSPSPISRSLLLLLLLLLYRPNRTRGSCEETCAPNTLTRCLMYTFFHGARAYKCHPAAAAVRSYDSRLCISVDISNIGISTMEVRRAINIIYTCVRYGEFLKSCFSFFFTLSMIHSLLLVAINAKKSLAKEEKKKSRCSLLCAARALKFAENLIFASRTRTRIDNSISSSSRWLSSLEQDGIAPLLLSPPISLSSLSVINVEYG